MSEEMNVLKVSICLQVVNFLLRQMQLKKLVDGFFS